MGRRLELSTVAVLIIHAIYLLVMYPKLPATVPMHLDFSGTADAFGPKASLWGLWWTSVGLYVLFWTVAFIPVKYWNLPFELDKEKTKPLLLEMIASFKLFTALLFAMLTLLFVRTATLGVPSGLSLALIVISLILPSVIVVTYLARVSAQASKP